MVGYLVREGRTEDAAKLKEAIRAVVRLALNATVVAAYLVPVLRVLHTILVATRDQGLGIRASVTSIPTWTSVPVPADATPEEASRIILRARAQTAGGRAGGAS